MKEPRLDEENLASDLKGNTVRVYWHLLRSSHGVVKVRAQAYNLVFCNLEYQYMDDLKKKLLKKQTNLARVS